MKTSYWLTEMFSIFSFRLNAVWRKIDINIDAPTTEFQRTKRQKNKTIPLDFYLFLFHKCENEILIWPLHKNGLNLNQLDLTEMFSIFSFWKNVHFEK